MATVNLKRAHEVAALVAADLSELEVAVDERLQELQVGHDAKEELVRRLVGRLREVGGLSPAINELQEANAKLCGACVRTTDGGAAAHG
jgi:hypothetical protein